MLLLFFLFSAWVDTAWELDFTETEPLDSRQESVITEDGLETFSQLHEGLSPFAEENGPTEVSSKLGAVVKL